MDRKVTLTTWMKDILILLVLLAFIIPVPVRLSVPAVEIKVGDEDFLEHKTIAVRGWYKINVFSRCRFWGRVIIYGYPETLNKMMEIEIDEDHGYPLVYTLEDGTKCFFGNFHAGFAFRRIAILIYERREDGGSFNTRDGRCLVARAKSYEEALKILKTHNILPAN